MEVGECTEETTLRIVRVCARTFKVSLVMIELLAREPVVWKSAETVQTPPRCVRRLLASSQTASVAVSPNVQRDRLVTDFCAQHGINVAAQFFATVPILWGNQAIGHLSIADEMPRETFSPSDAAKLQGVAELLSSLLEDRCHRSETATGALAALVVSTVGGLQGPLVSCRRDEQRVAADCINTAEGAADDTCSLHLEASAAWLASSVDSLSRMVEVSTSLSALVVAEASATVRASDSLRRRGMSRAAPSSFETMRALQQFLEDAVPSRAAVELLWQVSVADVYSVHVPCAQAFVTALKCIVHALGALEALADTSAVTVDLHTQRAPLVGTQAVVATLSWPAARHRHMVCEAANQAVESLCSSLVLPSGGTVWFDGHAGIARVSAPCTLRRRPARRALATRIERPVDPCACARVGMESATVTYPSNTLRRTSLDETVALPLRPKVAPRGGLVGFASGVSWPSALVRKLSTVFFHSPHPIHP